MKTVFKNTSNEYTLWWNRSAKITSVAIFDKNNVFLLSSKIYPGDYIIVPGNATLRLFLVSNN